MRLSRRPLVIALALSLFAALVVGALAHAPSAADAASCVPPGYVDGLNTPSCPPATAVPAVPPASAQLPVPTGIAIVPPGSVQQPGSALPPAPLAGGQPSPVTSVGDTAAVTRPQQPQPAVRQPLSVLPATGAGRGAGAMDRSLLVMLALGSGLLLAIGGTLVMRSRVRPGTS